jgi:hypothetical protein
MQRSETAGQEDPEKGSVVGQGTSDDGEGVDQFHDRPAQTAARRQIIKEKSSSEAGLGSSEAGQENQSWRQN